MNKVKTIISKSLEVKPNYNSADAISPNYVYGCFGGCMKSYCYVGRYNPDKIFITKNVTDIHQSIINWAKNLTWPKRPNQQDPIYYMVDIGCNTDIALHQKHINLDRILRFYNEHPKINLTFATKYSKMLTTNVTWMKKKPRVRVSLMPQIYSDILEPRTTDILTRIQDIDRLIELGWEVHINFSPIIVFDNWINLYSNLLVDINNYVFYKSSVKCEIIFLTNHKNTINQITKERKALLINSNEYKNNNVMRYPLILKKEYENTLKLLLKTYIPWCKIRYIF